MIERLRTTVAALAALPAAALTAPATEASRRDAADAVRLALDCMQGDLSPSQRDRLRELHDALEDVVPDGRRLHVSLQDASRMLAP